MYFGPAIILLFLFWKKFCKTVHHYGLGLSIVVIFGFIFSFSSEGRHSTAFFPIFITFLAKALNDYNWNWKNLSILGAISIFYSKFWFHINISRTQWDLDRNATLLFPMQRYFMHHAQYMNYQMYLVQGFFVLIAFIAFYFLFKHKNTFSKK